MEKTRWYKDMVFYQIWPRSFKDADADGMGDLWGVYEKLDYLKSLGVDGVWFSPLYPSPGADCGYDISDYMDIDSMYGGLEAFVETCFVRRSVPAPTFRITVSSIADGRISATLSRTRLAPIAKTQFVVPASAIG